MAASRPARALARGLGSLRAWARLTSGSLRLGAADVAPALDAQSRALLWHVLTETISAIAVLTAADAAPEAGLAALQTLADRVRERAAVAPPRAASPFDGAPPPQIFVLEILTHDLQPWLGRWRPRLDGWRDSGGQAAAWPLLALCRADLARTRERLVERSWQLGMALRLSGLERLLPDRPAIVSALTPPAELAAAENAANAPPDPRSRQAGWQIYVEAAARLPARDIPSGALGEAIAALDALAGEIRAALKASPPQPSGGAEAIQGQALALLSAGIQPFLTEWRPRYQRFAGSGRPEAKWRRAEECRAALAAARDRCLPTIRALGRTIGAPPLSEFAEAGAGGEAEAPLQLSPPQTRP